MHHFLKRFIPLIHHAIFPKGLYFFFKQNVRHFYLLTFIFNYRTSTKVKSTQLLKACILFTLRTQEAKNGWRFKFCGISNAKPKSFPENFFLNQIFNFSDRNGVKHDILWWKKHFSIIIVFKCWEIRDKNHFWRRTAGRCPCRCNIRWCRA